MTFSEEIEKEMMCHLWNAYTPKRIPDNWCMHSGKVCVETKKTWEWARNSAFNLPSISYEPYRNFK